MSGAKYQMLSCERPNPAFESGRADKQHAFGLRPWRRPLNANVKGRQPCGSHDTSSALQVC